jgi:hypothetical protein
LHLKTQKIVPLAAIILRIAAQATTAVTRILSPSR